VGALAPRDFHFPGPLKKHRGGHRFQNIAELQEVPHSDCVCKVYAENVHLLITRCDMRMNQAYYVEK
jgi:hypothetical protein